MKELKVLYLENSDSDEKRYRPWMMRAWTEAYPTVPIDIRVESDPDRLYETVQQFGPDLFIADLLFPDVPANGNKRAESPLGLRAIADVRTNWSNIAIIALSAGNGLENRSRAAGADGYISKSEIVDRAESANELLRAAFLSALRKRGLEPLYVDDCLRYQDDDYRLRSALETVGKEALQQLVVASIERKCKQIEPRYLKSGLSGAVALQMHCELAVDPKAPPEEISVFLKCDRDKERLKRELYKSLTPFPDGVFIKYFSQDPVESGSWHAIASRYHVSQTLLRWLQEPPLDAKTEPVEDMMISLFIQSNLTLTYSQLVEDQRERPNVALWKVISLSRRVRILEALKDLEPLCKKYSTKRDFDGGILRVFLGEQKRIGEIDEESVARGVKSCWSHGDLHASNILVTKHGPRLIDPANVEVMHWACDFARLAVDLTLSGIDGTAVAHEWSRVKRWQALSDEVATCRCSPLRSDKPNIRVWQAVAWLTKNLTKIVKGIEQSEMWQFQLAVAVEFLRASYRVSELSAPKRVTALIAAGNCLRLVSDELTRRL